MKTVNSPVEVPDGAVAAFAQQDGTWVVYEPGDTIPPALAEKLD